jgi:hypothetical protein
MKLTRQDRKHLAGRIPGLSPEGLETMLGLPTPDGKGQSPAEEAQLRMARLILVASPSCPAHPAGNQGCTFCVDLLWLKAFIAKNTQAKPQGIILSPH